MKRSAVDIAKREEEIMEAVHKREAEVDATCVQRKELIKDVDERVQWVLTKKDELKVEEMRLEEVNTLELEEKVQRPREQRKVH